LLVGQFSFHVGGGIKTLLIAASRRPNGTPISGRKNIQIARRSFGTGKNLIHPNPQMKQRSQLCHSKGGVPDRATTIQLSSGDSNVPQRTAPTASMDICMSVIISCPTPDSSGGEAVRWLPLLAIFYLRNSRLDCEIDADIYRCLNSLCVILAYHFEAVPKTRPHFRNP
jgi:hypothetical protein